MSLGVLSLGTDQFHEADVLVIDREACNELRRGVA
jgi:hypothetical protein